jgi:hypothetical protein
MQHKSVLAATSPHIRFRKQANHYFAHSRGRLLCNDIAATYFFYFHRIQFSHDFLRQS